jgi:hypothetical protein
MAATPYISGAEKYLQKLEASLSSPPLSSHRARVLFGDFLAVAEAPPPDQRLAGYFHNEAVLVYLAEHLFVPYAWNLREVLQRIGGSTRRNRGAFYRVRNLSGFGSYPNTELVSGRAHYVVHRGQPFLVTLNSEREEAKWSFGSELADWTRHETRLATAMSCTEFGGFSPYLSSRWYDFPVGVVAAVNTDDRISFLVECAALLMEVRARRPRPQWRDMQDTSFVPEFYDFRPHQKRAQVFASKFLVSHPLLLRTAKHFLKSSMLWRADGFSEDAFANLLFALEGCMLLFQDSWGEPTDRLNRKLLRNILVATYEHGESMLHFMEEALGWGGTRAQLVHPHLAFEDGWIPFMMADDYYEFHKMVRALLSYLVTGTSFRDYELAR